MYTNYQDIEEVEHKISDWLKGKFLKERMLFGDMAILMLESFKQLENHYSNSSKSELALLTLSSRMFNDCEGAKQLLLWGLPDQAQPLIRDIIECTLLFRLLSKNPRLAERWLINLSEYQPGHVNAQLKELGIEAREYALYGTLSHSSHSNLLASLSHVQEKEVGENSMLRVFHLGAARTPEAEQSIQRDFIILFYLMHVALVEPLAEFYYQHTDEDIYNTWVKKIGNLVPRLVDITSEIKKQKVIGSNSIDPVIHDLAFKKMRIENLKKGWKKFTEKI